MTIYDKRSVLTGLKVKSSMRRNPLRMGLEQSLDRAISGMIKFKVSAVLINEGGQDHGLITKTDLMTLYYAGLPLSTPLGDVLVAPIVTCYEDDPLETALSRIIEHGVKRIYACERHTGTLTGVLSYADIAGLLYRYCSRCVQRRSQNVHLDEMLCVRDVMRQDAVACSPDQSIAQALEILSGHDFSALLVHGHPGGPPGVLSKTDLILAYRHNVPLEEKVMAISSFPALGCARDESLVYALRRMILADVHRLFVHGPDPHDIQGVLSLTDAARARSGSCRACSASRLE